MKPLNYLKPKDKKKIIEELNNNFGITNLPYLLLATGKKKIRAYSGHLSKEEIQTLNETTNIELIGTYLINKKDTQLRLAFDAITLKEIKNQITKNIVEINEQQLQLWLRGHDLEFWMRADERSESAINKTPTSKTGVQLAPQTKPIIGPVILKYLSDLVGTGKSNETKIFNYVPKERKLKTPIK
jgi:NOL1/NOP2/fmu family ribosome biogenesis protein